MRAKTPTPLNGSGFVLSLLKDEDIVHTLSNEREVYDVGSAYPGAGEGAKGLAVRQLKSHASWVKTVVRQVGLLSAVGVDS